MDNNEYIIKLQKKEKELIRICNFMSVYKDDAKDLIQDLYLTLLNFNNINRYVLNGEPNMFIIFAIIRNVIYKNNNSKKYNLKIDEIINFDERYSVLESEYNLEEETLFNLKIDIINEEFNSIEKWYDKEIINLLYLKGELKSIRSLAKETTISNTSIQKISYMFRNKCIEKYKNQKV